MEKYVVDLNGTLLATSGIIHGMIAAMSGKDSADEEKKSKKKNNILPARRFDQIIRVSENGVEYPENVKMPGVSGNAFRGIIRRLLVEHSFDVLDIAISDLFDKDSIGQAVWFMFNNGGLTPKGSSIISTNLSVYDEVASIPWLGLLGSVYYGHQFEGCASFGILYPIVKENIYLWQDTLQLSDSEISALPSYSATLKILDEAHFTRRANSRDNSAGNDQFLLIEDMNSDDVKDSMIYGAEYIPAGLQLVSLNRCITHDPNIVKAFKAGMAIFLTSHLSLGGKSAMGFGRVRVCHGFDFDMEEAIADYDKMLLDNKDDIIRKIKLIPEGLKFKMKEKDKAKDKVKDKEVA